MPTPLHLDRLLNHHDDAPMTGRRLVHLAADTVENIPADAPTRQQVTHQLAVVRRAVRRPPACNMVTTVTTRELATITAVLEQAAHHWHHTQPPTDELALARRLTSLTHAPDDPSIDYVLSVMQPT